MASRRSDRDKSKPKGKRRVSYVVIQCIVGGIFFGIWAFVSMFMFGDPPGVAAMHVGPYAAFYVLGILSRYLPGVSSFARRFEP